MFLHIKINNLDNFDYLKTILLKNQSFLNKKLMLINIQYSKYYLYILLIFYFIS